MKIINIQAKNPEIELYSARVFLRKLDYTPTTSSQQLHYRIFEPFNEKFYHHEEYSVTDNSSIYNRIRFWNFHRFIRSIIFTVNQCTDENTISKVNVYCSDKLDDLSKKFFDMLYHIHGIHVIYHTYDNNQPLDEENLLSPEEKKIALGIQLNEVPRDNIDEFIHYIPIYYAYGLSKTIRNLTKIILNTAMQENVNSKVYADCYCYLAAASIMEVDTVAGEMYSKLFLKYAKDVNIHRAKYFLALIYLRHHPPYLRNHEKGKKLLEEAFEDLNAIPNISKSEYLQFLRVFIMNGFALAYYREGKYNEVIELMDWGLKELAKLENKHVVIIHKCVLMFNKALVYIKEKDKEKALKELKKLIKFDPNYPDYHLEIASLQSELGNYDEAIEELNIVLDMNPTLFEALAMKAWAYLKKKDFVQAQQFFSLANKYSSYGPIYTYDYLVSLFENKDFKTILGILNKSNYLGHSIREYEDIHAIHVDTLCNLGEAEKARNILVKSKESGFTTKKTDQNIKRLTAFIQETSK